MPKLGYISVNLVEETEKQLKTALTDLGIQPATTYPFHITLMYDKSECEEPRCDINSHVLFKATIIGFKELGDAIVAELHSVGLQQEFRRLTDAGYTHSYSTLLLHMSLVYDPTRFDLIKINTELANWLGKEVTFTYEHIRDCE